MISDHFDSMELREREDILKFLVEASRLTEILELVSVGACWIWPSDVSRTPGQTGLQFVGFLQCPVCTCIYIHRDIFIHTLCCIDAKA